MYTSTACSALFGLSIYHYPALVVVYLALAWSTTAPAAAPRPPSPAPLHQQKGRVLFSVDASPELSPSSLFSLFSSSVRALLASTEAWHVCGSGLPALIAEGAPHRRIWPVAHAEVRSLPFSPSPSLSSFLTARILAALP